MKEELHVSTTHGEHEAHWKGLDQEFSSAYIHPRQATALLVDSPALNQKSVCSLMVTISSLLESLDLPGQDPDF